jgi:hypothetical protein
LTGRRGEGGGGPTELFYCATGPAVYDEKKGGPWSDVRDALAETDDWRTFEQLSNWFKAALVAGAVTRHDDTCLAWTILSLDQKGWERVLASLEKLHVFVVEEHERAEARLEKSRQDPMGMVVALGLFETPRPVKES